MVALKWITEKIEKVYLGHPISQYPYTLTTPQPHNPSGDTCTFIGKYHMGGYKHTPKCPNLPPHIHIIPHTAVPSR